MAIQAQLMQRFQIDAATRRAICRTRMNVAAQIAQRSCRSCKDTSSTGIHQRGSNMSSVKQQWRNGMIGLIGALALLVSGIASADPPSRAARLTQMTGTITFSPAGEDDWAVAQANRPVITGDRLWSDAGSHAELEVGTAAVRLGSETNVDVLNFDDRVMQLQLAQGTVNLRVNSIVGDQFYEIDTPNLAFSVRRAGDYRIDVDPNG